MTEDYIKCHVNIRMHEDQIPCSAKFKQNISSSPKKQGILLTPHPQKHGVIIIKQKNCESILNRKIR